MTKTPKPMTKKQQTKALLSLRDNEIRDLREYAATLQAQLAEARNAALEEAATVCEAARDRRNKQRRSECKHDRGQQQRWMAGALQAGHLCQQIRALKSEPGLIRCAECDCEKGGADCTWIRTPAPRQSVQEEAKVLVGEPEAPFLEPASHIAKELRQAGYLVPPSVIYRALKVLAQEESQ